MRIALIGRDADRVLAFRGSLIRLAQRRGHEVIAITGPAQGDEPIALADAGVRWLPAPLHAGGLSPLADLAYHKCLVRTLRREAVDAVLAYNPKCLAQAPLAARKAGVHRVVGMVTGLGHGFIGHGARERLVRLMKASLWRRAFQACDTVLVQNDLDLLELRRCGALPESTTARVQQIAGSGVDLVHFTATPLPRRINFLMVSRPLREKGLPEFLEAAARAKAIIPEASFSWLGKLDDPNPSALNGAELRRWLAHSPVQYLSTRHDVRPVLYECTALVLPSHREGTSKVVLEAMASGRGVITSDAPGCGHVIEHGRSGLIVPRGSTDALVGAMMLLARDFDLAGRMGMAARARAELLYASEPVDETTLSALIGS